MSCLTLLNFFYVLRNSQEFFKLHALYRMLTGHGFAAPTIQIASFITSQAQTPRRGREPLDTSNVSPFTPPPGHQDSEPPNTSPSLPRGAGTPVPKSKPRPHPVLRKSRTTSSASAISASALASDSIRPPTTPSAVSDLIEEVDPVFSIADRAKTRTRKTQVKKPTYVPVNHDVIELTSDSHLDELSLEPPQSGRNPKTSPSSGPLTKATICPRTKTLETTKITPKSVAAQPKQTPSVTLQSRTVSKPKSTPMSELIRLRERCFRELHRSTPNRQTPPPPLPKPPPPKKSKKQIEMEDHIEEELSETVEGGGEPESMLSWSIITTRSTQTFQIRKSNSRPQLLCHFEDGLFRQPATGDLPLTVSN
ncbi:hypothetical protein C8R48DRAFT_834397 [Suillus tomentosus]|nr:hypothetical protein C8R48DRAFT_834397 [Suillus tomentosus]